METTTVGRSVLPDLPAKCLYGKNNIQKDPHPIYTAKIEQKIYPDILHCIGNTPLIKLDRIPKSMGIECDVLVKCEFLNPGGSVKDRIARSMIEDAEKRGVLKPGYTMIEPTAGNTGLALTMVGAVKGYQSVSVVPDKTSSEKESIINAMGGKMIRVPDNIRYDQPGSIYSNLANIQNTIPNSVILHQFRNSANSLTHYYTTAKEIYDQCDEALDMVVGGIGTGGTMTGISRRLKNLLPNILIVAVDPYGSVLAPAYLNKTNVKFYEIEGIGLPFSPTTFDKNAVDFWVKVNDKESFNMARKLHREEGILCGGSAGAILCGALKAAKSLKKGQKCVVILPDGVGNYLNKFVSDYWMELRNFIPCKNTFNHWWWDCKVSLLNPKVKMILINTTTCEAALKIIRSSGHDVLPVVDNHNNLKGIVSSKNIMSLLFNSRAKPNDSIEKVMSEKYATVTLDSTFGILSRILDNEGVAAVVKKEKESEQENCKLIGMVFPTDFLHYISENCP